MSSGRRALLFALLVALGLGASVLAETDRVRTVEVRASVRGTGRTPEEAKHEALQRARQKAVSEVAGVYVSAQQLRLKTDHTDDVKDAFSSLVSTTSHGRIVREDARFTTRLVDDVPLYEIVLRADVVVEHGARDPGFSVDLQARPASHTFRDGEQIVLEITPTRSCYLTVLNLLEDGSVLVVSPAEGQQPVEFAADKTVAWPPSQLGLELRSELPRGRNRAREHLLVIATREPVPVRIRPGEEDATGADWDATWAAVNRWLLQIPLERRAEALWTYEIVR